MRVIWKSEGQQYRALKTTRKEIWGNLRSTILHLVDERLKPTKIISDFDMISRLKHNHISSLRGASLYFDCSIGMLGVELQVERRINDGTIYILYEQLENAKDEALEFAGLDELP